MPKLAFRRATAADRATLKSLQTHSIRELGTGFYPRNAIESFITQIGTMDDYLITDGTYLVATLDNVVVGCGGWSTRRPTYDSCEGASGESICAPDATVRSVYTHPEWARRGIGREIMKRIESYIRDSGFRTAKLTATLSGIPLYRHLGYEPVDLVTLSLRGGVTFKGLKMAKSMQSKAQERPAA